MIRAVMALISLMVLVTISVSEKNLVFLLIGVVVAVIFLRFGNKKELRKARRRSVRQG